MTQITPQCSSCKWWIDGTSKCVAFPDGIPHDILFNRVSHKKPYKGDGGYRYIDRGF